MTKLFTTNRIIHGLKDKAQAYTKALRSLHSSSIKSCDSDVKNLSSQLQKDGFIATSFPILSASECETIKGEIPRLFRGEFETGVYPDEWHYREGISLENVTREICNAWKSSPCIASFVLNEQIGRWVADIMDWDSVRLAQDDIIWKTPSKDNHKGNNSTRSMNQGIDTVGFHQDSAYISTQFLPQENNSVTVWFALDDVFEHTGCLEYVTGSHQWRPILHQSQEECDVDTDISSEAFHSSDEASYRNPISIAASHAGVKRYNHLIQKVTVSMGHVVLHHQDVWHGSGPNLSLSLHRRALVAHYLRGDVEFRDDGINTKGPWGKTSYIYGRYKKYGSPLVDETFFPVVFATCNSNLRRTEWIDDFIKKYNR